MAGFYKLSLPKWSLRALEFSEYGEVLKDDDGKHGVLRATMQL